MDEHKNCTPENHWREGSHIDKSFNKILSHLRKAKVPGVCPLCSQHRMAILTDRSGDKPMEFCGIMNIKRNYLICMNCGNMCELAVFIAEKGDNVE